MNSFFLPYCVIGSFFHISFPEVFPIKNLLVFSSFLMALHGFPTLFEQFFSLNYSFYSMGVQKNNYSCMTKECSQCIFFRPFCFALCTLPCESKLLQNEIIWKHQKCKTNKRKKNKNWECWLQLKIFANFCSQDNSNPITLS